MVKRYRRQEVKNVTSNVHIPFTSIAEISLNLYICIYIYIDIYNLQGVSYEANHVILKLFAIEKYVSNKIYVVSRGTSYGGHKSCLDDHTSKISISMWPWFFQMELYIFKFTVLYLISAIITYSKIIQSHLTPFKVYFR